MEQWGEKEKDKSRVSFFKLFFLSSKQNTKLENLIVFVSLKEEKFEHALESGKVKHPTTESLQKSMALREQG